MPDDKPLTPGERADQLYQLALQKRALEATIQELDKTMEILEHELIAELDQLGTSTIKTKFSKVYINETEVPMFSDYQLFADYVESEGAQYLYQKRIASNAWRELRQAGIDVPGIVPFVKRKLSIGKP